MSEHRLSIARDRAGLSLGQAAKLLGMERSELAIVEALPVVVRCAYVEKMADLYGVNVPWLLGETPRHDYEAMKDARGWDSLPQSDKDTVAEFAASLPRDTQTAAERIAEVAAKKRTRS